MSASIGEAVLHLVGDATQLITGSKKAKLEVEGILGKMGIGLTAAGIGVAAVATAVTGLGVGIMAMTTKGAASADQIMEMSAKYSVAADQIQKMKYAAELVDVPLETMLGSFTRLTMSMGVAKDVTSEQAAIFKSLEVDAIDPLTGQLRSANDVWMETIGALNGVQNSAERDAISLKLFGRSAFELNPLIEAGTDALKELGEEAKTSGYVMTESQLKALGKVDDAIQKLKRGAEGVLNQLAGIFAPGVSKVVEVVGGYMGKLGAILGDESLSSADKIDAAAELVKTIATDITNNLPKIAEAGIGVLQSLVQGIVDSIPTLMPAAVDVLMSLLNFIIEMLPILADGAVQMVLAIAVGIGEALPELIPAVVEMLLMLVTIIIESLPLLLDAGMKIVDGLIDGIIGSIPQLVSLMTTIIPLLVRTLLTLIPQMWEAASQIILGLLTGLTDGLPGLANGGISMIEQICDAIITELPKIIEVGVKVGESLLDGIWTALANALPRLLEQFKTYFITSSMTDEEFNNLLFTKIDSMATPSRGTRYSAAGLVVGTSPSNWGSTVTNNYNLTGNYRYQDETTLIDQVKILQLLGGQ